MLDMISESVCNVNACYRQIIAVISSAIEEMTLVKGIFFYEIMFF